MEFADSTTQCVWKSMAKGLVSESLQHAQIVLSFTKGQNFAGMQIEERYSFGVSCIAIDFTLHLTLGTT